MHLVTEIKESGKKLQITLDESIVFQLYKGEARRFGITPDAEVSEKTFAQIYDVLTKRAKERAMYLVKDMEKSEKQVRDKLRAGYYPSDIIEQALDFLKKYNYVNDARYARLYIESKKDKKSIRQITLELYRRGISAQLIEDALEQCDVSNSSVLDNMIAKKIRQYDCSDRKEMSKLYRYFVGKGFSYDEVSTALEKYRLDVDEL